MPLFASLFSAVGGAIFSLIAALVGAKSAIKVIAVITIASMYVGTVVLFSGVISPWIGAVFTTQYGQLLGLLFPPVAGTIIASLAAYWASVLSFKYLSSLTRMAAG